MGDEIQNRPAVDVFALAERLGLRPAEIYRAVKDGHLAATKTEKGTVFAEEDIEAYLQQRESADTTLREEIDQWLASIVPAVEADAEEAPDDASGPGGGAAATTSECEASSAVPAETLDQKQDRLVDALLCHALGCGALDVYLDPVEGGARVLYRTAGAVRETGRMSPGLRDGVCARLKGRFGVKEAVSEPHSGMFSVPYEESTVQVRGTVAPTVLGEHVHAMFIRALHPQSLRETGLTPEQEKAVRGLLDGKAGLFLTVGPVEPSADQFRLMLATTLAAGSRMVVSLEHRQHAKCEELVQLRVSTAEGADFRAMFQAALAMSPNVLIIDIVNGPEEAGCLLEAVAAGIAVVAHIRAGDNVQALLSLIEYGIPRNTLAKDLLGLSARRSIRRVCSRCRDWRAASSEEVDRVSLDTGARVAVAKGCDACSDGFDGRIACHDLWVASADLRDMLRRLEPPAEDLRDWAQGQELSWTQAVREAVQRGDVLLEDAAPLL